ARLDERLALPRIGPIAEVGHRRAQGDHQLAVPAARAQVEVDAEHLPLGIAARDQARHIARQAGEELLVADRAAALRAAPGGLAVPREEVEEIDVAAVVQLLAPELAQGDDGEGGALEVALVVAPGGRGEAPLERGP